MMTTGWRSSVSGWWAAVALLAGSLLTVGAPLAAAQPLAGGNEQQLSGVFCTSATSCWAVGVERSSNGAVLNQVLRLTGGTLWHPVTVPNPAGTAANDANTLAAVRCASASNCWAVGYYQLPGSARLDQVLHWNGKKWSVVTAPTPGGTSSGDFNQLMDVVCTSARNCWAVGRYGIEMATSTGESAVQFTQVLHWNGRMWSLVSSPNPGGHSQNHANSLNAVRCTSAKNCWAAGTSGLLGTNFVEHNLMLRWNGVKWTSVQVPNPGGTAKSHINRINGLGCTSAANCWAAGSYGSAFPGKTDRLLNQTLHWNGQKWAKVTTPNPGGTGPDGRNELEAITCTAARNCWAVGWTGGTNRRFGVNQAVHWNGKKWSVVPTPNGNSPGDIFNSLNSIRCTSSTSCWAVGVAELSRERDDQILLWNGVKWLET